MSNPGLDNMAELHEGARELTPGLQLVDELRQEWATAEALRSTPRDLPAPVTRAKLVIVIPFVCIAIATGYFAGHRAGLDRTPPHAVGTLRRHVAPRPAVRGPSPFVSLDAASLGQVRHASGPSPSAPPTTTLRVTASVTPSAPAILANGPDQSAVYHIQVGAFNVREYAQDLVHQLRAHAYPATVVDVPTGPRHRVWIDGGVDRSSAERLVSRLRRDGFEAILLRP
jgi:hypothetical protein